MTTIYIGIGSNLDDPLAHVITAIHELGQLDGCQFLSASSLYKSRPLSSPASPPASNPMYTGSQPDYINAVVAINTTKDELKLLDDLQDMEHRHGRVREGERWGPRTLDLDILLADDKIINHPRLIIPHPGLHQRSFVLYPLQEIAPDLIIPGHGSLQELIAQCDDEGLERLSEA